MPRPKEYKKVDAYTLAYRRSMRRLKKALKEALILTCGSLEAAANKTGFARTSIYKRISECKTLRVMDFWKFSRYIPEDMKDEMRRLILP